MENSKYRVHEAVGFDFCPGLETIRRQAYFVDRFFVGSMGIETGAAHGVVKLVDLIGHSILSRKLGGSIYLGVDLCTSRRVLSIEVLFVEFGNLIEVGLFRRVV